MQVAKTWVVPLAAGALTANGSPLCAVSPITVMCWASCGAIALRIELCALAVERALLFLAYRITIIGGTPNSGLLLAMSSPAAKGTTQVFTAAITRMRQEKDPAMPAADQTAA